MTPSHTTSTNSSENHERKNMNQTLKVLRNDDKKLLNLDRSKIESIIISPGPGTP